MDSMQDNKRAEKPRVFISYSWEEDAHQEWVRSLADKLLWGGIDVRIDQYDTTHGDRLPQFMEQEITASDYVLIICTPAYKVKADNRKSGVGYEGDIISAELLSKNNERKFIPILRKGDFYNAIPTFLGGKKAADFTSEQNEKKHYPSLLETLYGVMKKPAVGKKPSFITTKDYTEIPEDGEIKIEGIITEKVTMPKMDGSPGSALYSVPFKLNRKPSSLWSDLFVHTWDNPPQWSTMHRFGNASVTGDTIVLEGTTMDEVKQYHRDTLLLCVKRANDGEKLYRAHQRAEEIKRKEIEQNHYDNVQKLADEIEF